MSNEAQATDEDCTAGDTDESIREDTSYLRSQQVREIAVQAAFALLSIQNLTHYYDEVNELNRERDERYDELRRKEKAGEISQSVMLDGIGALPFYRHTSPLPVFLNLLSFLSHAAMVSKLLWPTDTSNVRRETAEHVGTENVERLKRLRKARGAELRGELGIKDTWIIERRTLRDHMEHYDERLEEWWIASRRHNLMDLSQLARSDVSGLDDTDFHRVFDQRSGLFIFRNEDFDIGAMRQEIETVLVSAIRWLDDHGDHGSTSSLLDLNIPFQTSGTVNHGAQPNTTDTL